jgi:hypothetical protein
MIQVQAGGLRLACAARTLHLAAWPELYPEGFRLKPHEMPSPKAARPDRRLTEDEARALLRDE